MNIFEYIFEKDKDALVYDKSGNLYIYYDKCTSDRYREFYNIIDYYTDCISENCGFVSVTNIEELNKIEIIVSDEIWSNPVAKRPYYRMRGKSVSKEQAFDIISRTDYKLEDIDEIGDNPDYVSSINFDNELIEHNYGWVHVDGKIGCNYHTNKYPTIYEFVNEWFCNIKAFPYLDLVIAITYWNEVNDKWWETHNVDINTYDRVEYDKDFYDNIEMGIYVHSNKIEILGREDIIQLFSEYDDLYGKEREKFNVEYYTKNGIKQVDLEYLKKCVERYGLDADTVMKRR